MNPKLKDKIIEAIDEGKITDETTLGVFKMVEEMREEIDEVIKKVEEKTPDLKDILEQVKGKEGYTPVKGVDYFDGEDGEDADESAIEERITKKLPDEKKIISVLEKKLPSKESVVKECMAMMPTKEEIAREVEIPEPEKIDEQEIVLKVENNLPQLGEKIRDGLELLTGDDRLDKSAIKNLVEELKELRELIQQKSQPISGGVRNSQIISEAVTGTVDGVNDTFYLSTTPKKNSLLLVWNGQPQRPGTSQEYLLTGKQIVFNAGSIPTTGGLWSWYTKF